MREITGDLWTIKADARVIPTNGSVRRDGAAVMGRGVALQAKRRHPKLEEAIGAFISAYGNRVYFLFFRDENLVTFPVKHRWQEKAKLKLIENSCQQLVRLTKPRRWWKRIALPRVGCGNGGLDWKDVKPILEEYLDDRFIVVKWKEEGR